MVLVESLERRLFQVEALYEIGREFARVHSADEALRVVVSTLIGAFGATGGLAVLLSPEGELVAHAARGVAGHLSEATLTEWARCATGAAPAALAIDPLPDMGRPIPFSLESGGAGAVALEPRLDGSAYGDDDLALLGEIVANAAPLLDRILLVEALHGRTRDLARRVEVLQTANDLALAASVAPGARQFNQRLVERLAHALAAARCTLVQPGKGGDEVVLARWPTVGGHLDLPLGPLDPTRLRTATIHFGQEEFGAVRLERDADQPPFDAQDDGLLNFLATQAAVLVENGRLIDRFLSQQQEQFRLRAMLEQYLAPSVAERLIAGETRPVLEGTRLTVSVLMVDVRNSTRLITHVEPEIMVRFLNDYLGRMTDVMFRFEGTVDKFTGDSLLGFFGAPEQNPDDAARALRAASRMHHEFDRLAAEWRSRHPLPTDIGVGVGVATGEVIVGNIGSAKRLEHTVIGTAVNLAARLTARAPAGTIQIDHPTWDAARPHLLVPSITARRRPRHVRAKGFAELVPMYRLRHGDYRGWSGHEPLPV